MLLEVHVFDFCPGVVWTRDRSGSFVAKLRDEVKFDSLDGKLIVQMKIDGRSGARSAVEGEL